MYWLAAQALLPFSDVFKAYSISFREENQDPMNTSCTSYGAKRFM